MERPRSRWGPWLSAVALQQTRQPPLVPLRGAEVSNERRPQRAMKLSQDGARQLRARRQQAPSTRNVDALGLSQSFVLFNPNIFHIFRAQTPKLCRYIVQKWCVWRPDLGDSGAVEALIQLGLGREDRVLVFRCDFATRPTPPVRMVSF